MFASIVLLNLLIGSKSFNSIVGVKCGSAWYIIIQIIFVLECIGMTILAIKMTLKESRIKNKFDINVSPNDFKYNKSGIALLTAIGILGGVLVGGIGVGGGVVFNPALLALGYEAQVANSTGMFLAMISYLTALITNALANNLKYDYALWLSAFSVAAAVLGIFFGDWVIKKLRGRSSFIIWMLVAVFVISIVAAIYSGID